MKNLVKKNFQDSKLKDAKISFKMVENGVTLASLAEDLFLTPASNTKIVISAAALLANPKELFPPMEGYINGSIFEGTVHGDLILDSCGSLVFSARHTAENDFEKMNEILELQVKSFAEKLRKNGAVLFLGNLKISFNRWQGSSENLNYNAATPFSFHENSVDIKIAKGKIYTVPVQPEIFKFVENTHVVKQEKSDDNNILFNPQVDSQDFWRISQTDVNDYALRMLKNGLSKNGIKFLNSSEIENSKLIKISETPSLYTLDEFILPMNRDSDNFRAELLALCLIRAKKGKADYQFLGDALKEIFTENKVSWQDAIINDGSGLSVENRLSAKQIVDLLEAMQKHPSFKKFLNSLSLAGKYGTLKNRFKNSPWEGTFYGKTGTLDKVTSLSGYWLREGKKPVIFSFIGNGADNEDFWSALEKFVNELKFMA